MTGRGTFDYLYFNWRSSFNPVSPYGTVIYHPEQSSGYQGLLALAIANKEGGLFTASISQTEDTNTFQFSGYTFTYDTTGVQAETLPNITGNIRQTFACTSDHTSYIRTIHFDNVVTGHLYPFRTASVSLSPKAYNMSHWSKYYSSDYFAYSSGGQWSTTADDFYFTGSDYPGYKVNDSSLKNFEYYKIYTVDTNFVFFADNNIWFNLDKNALDSNWEARVSRDKISPSSSQVTVKINTGISSWGDWDWTIKNNLPFPITIRYNSKKQSDKNGTDSSATVPALGASNFTATDQSGFGDDRVIVQVTGYNLDTGYRSVPGGVFKIHSNDSVSILSSSGGNIG